MCAESALLGALANFRGACRIHGSTSGVLGSPFLALGLHFRSAPQQEQQVVRSQATGQAKR